MDVVCRDDEKKGTGRPVPFLVISEHLGVLVFQGFLECFYLLYISTLGDFLGVYFFKPVEGRI